MNQFPDVHLARSFRQSSSLRDDASQHPLSFGCTQCPELNRCGGLHSGADMYDCDALCNCADKVECDRVCRRKAKHFVQSVREVHGLELDNVPRAAPVAIPVLPKVIPIIEHRSSRNERFLADAIALPLYRIIDLQHGKLHVQSREELAERFRISTDAQIVLSGVEKDRYIERWWELKNRVELLQGLVQLGIGMVTSPNFSVLTDVPRTDNLHAIKRIALAWAEIASVGLPAALHVNARTEQDYMNWQTMIADREEIAALAFEFATGCGRPERIDWHVEQLCKLAENIDRPLALVMRGGSHKLHILAQHYCNVTLLETESFSKTRCRRRAQIADGKLKWPSSLTPKGAALDELLAHNAATVRRFHEAPRTSAPRLQIRRRPLHCAANRNDQSIQPSLLDNIHFARQARPVTTNCHHMIAAPKA